MKFSTVSNLVGVISFLTYYCDQNISGLAVRLIYFMLVYIYSFFPQVFYYLSELNDALSYALGAGSLFDVSEDSDYVHTLLGKNAHIECKCQILT